MRPTGTIWFDLPHRFEHRLTVGGAAIDIHADGQKARLDECSDMLTLTLQEPLALQSAGVPVLLHGMALNKPEPSLVLQAQVPLRPQDARRWLETSPTPNRIAQVAQLTHHRSAAIAGVAGYTLASAGIGPALGLLAGAKLLKFLAQRWATQTVKARLPHDLDAWQPVVSGLLAGKITWLPVDLQDLVATGAGATEALVSLADNGLGMLRSLSGLVDFGRTDLRVALAPGQPTGDRACGGGLSVRDLHVHIRPAQFGHADAVHTHVKVKLRRGHDNPWVQEVDLRTDFRLPDPAHHANRDDAGSSHSDAAQAHTQRFLPPPYGFMEKLQCWLAGINASGQLVLRGQNQGLSNVARLKIDHGAVLDVSTVRAGGRPGMIRLVPPKDSQRNIRVKLHLQGAHLARYQAAEGEVKYVHHHSLIRAAQQTRSAVRNMVQKAGLSITYLQAVEIVPRSLLSTPDTSTAVVDIQLSHGFDFRLSPHLVVQSSNNVWNGSWHPDTDPSGQNLDAVLLQIPRYVMPVDAEAWQHWSHVTEGVVRLMDRFDCRDGGLLDVSCLTGHQADLSFGVEHAQRATSAAFYVAAGDHCGKVTWTTIAPSHLQHDRDD